MIRKKGIIPIIAIVIGMVIYELIVIYVFNWTGLFRTVIAAAVGGLCFSIGKMIEKSIIKSENQKTDVEPNNKRLHIISFVLIAGIVFGINLFANNRTTTWKDFNDEIGNFSIQFPDIPIKETSEQQWMYGKLIWNIYKVIPEQTDMNICYLVRYCDLPPSTINSDSLRLIQDIANLTQMDIANKAGAPGLVNLTIKQVNKYPGREYRWKVISDNIGYTTRCFVVKNRIFVIEVKYKIENDFNNDIEGFHNKFKLLKITDNTNPENMPERPTKDFEIDFPDKPAIRENPLYHELVGNIYAATEAYEVPAKERNNPNLENLLYGVNYVKLPNNRITSDSTELVKKLLTTAIQSIGKVKQQKEIKFNGYWGLDAKIEVSNVPVIYHIKTFVVKEMYYQIMVVTIKGKENNKAEIDFINSFRLK